MELKKLMEHISIIPDYRQAWKVDYPAGAVYRRTNFGCRP
ncbi:hypothetical protein, partial [Escherichia coli]